MKLVELYAVADTFATAMGRVDVLSGGLARFVWYVERKNEDGTSDNVIVASIIMAIDRLPSNFKIINDALNTKKPVSEAGACLH